MNISFKIYIFYSVKILSSIFMVPLLIILSFLNVLLKKLYCAIYRFFKGEKNHTDGIEVSKPHKELIVQLYFNVLLK